MKLLLIGATSFIGNKIYKFAKHRNFDVIGTSSKYGTEYVKFDLLKDSISTALKGDKKQTGEKYAIITAFFTGHERIISQLKKSRLINIGNSIKLMHDLTEMGYKILYFSTEQVFSGNKGTSYVEDDLVDPVLEYGRQKAEIENYITSYFPDVLVYRLSQVIGDSPEGNHIWHDVYESHIQNKSVYCIKGQVLCPTYLDDVVKYALLGLEKDLKGIYHMANPFSMSRYELSKLLLDRLKSNVEIKEAEQEFFKFSEPRPLNTSLDISKFSKMMGDKFVSMDELADIFIENSLSK